MIVICLYEIYFLFIVGCLLEYDNHPPCCQDYIDECHYNLAEDNRLGFMKAFGISWAGFIGGIVALLLIIVASVFLTRCSANNVRLRHPICYQAELSKFGRLELFICRKVIVGYNEALSFSSCERLLCQL